MAVVVLDPLRPTMIPLDAVEHLSGTIEFTEEVPVAVRWPLPAARLVDGSHEAELLITTTAEHDAALARIERGEQVYAAPQLPGDSVVEAVELMDRMWSFGGWEVTQTHDSLRPYLLEETYELLDAIGSGKPDEIREELGDLLLQVLFHSRIAQASDRPFTVDDVAATLVAKLVHRSPHVADTAVGPIDIGEQERAWERRKASEKARRSCLDGIAMAQPALALAEKVLTRGARAHLPADLTPVALKTVTIGGDGSAEEELRKAVLAFAGQVRAAEDAAEADRGERAPLSADQWRKYWPAG